MKLLYAVAIAAVLASAENLRAHRERSDGVGTHETTSADCAHWISTAPTFQVCISSNGTLVTLQIEGRRFLDANLEGHALCYAGGWYYDLFSNEVGWQGPILVSQSSSTVVIRRTTTDDRFTLTQTWTRKPKERATTVTNALRANIATTGVYFARTARVAPDGTPTGSADWGRHGYWVRQTFSWDALTVTDTSFAGAYAWVGGLDIEGYCRAVHAPNGPTGWAYWTQGFIRYFAGNMAAGQTKKYSVTYRGH